MNTPRKGDWMQLFSGKRFWPLDPRPEEVDILDIAHALSQQCRYAGHCLSYYSVAQHSVLVSRHVPPEYAVWGLLHDAAEAYLVDLPRPVKVSVTGYVEAEEKVLQAVAEHFGLALPFPDAVHWADVEALVTEKRDLMAPCEWDWNLPPEAKAWDEPIEGCRPWEARRQFLVEAYRLGLKGASQAIVEVE